MPTAFKKGDIVKQVAPAIQGEVVGVGIIDDDVQFCVEYKTADGEVHQRFFTEAEIQAAG